MSELKNISEHRTVREQLLSTASALALLVATFAAPNADAADGASEHPTVWIELGGNMEHVNGQGDMFSPEFLAMNPNSVVLQPTTPLQAQRPPAFQFGEEGKLSVQPQGSDWLLSASVRYGRSSNLRHVKHQTDRVFSHSKYGSKSITSIEKFSDTQVKRNNSYMVLDFAAGKDIGIGMFGREGSSVVGFGVRFAQFASKSTFDVRARPDLTVNYKYFYNYKFPKADFRDYHATGSAARSFHGLGPSLSWTGTMPVAGNPHDGQIVADWGLNASLLFGKQKTRVQHSESEVHKTPVYTYPENVYQRSGEGHANTRSVVVPNAGAFAGASYRLENFKLSFGYRADFFFGALDGGIDTTKSETLGFYGPFATISVGLGG